MTTTYKDAGVDIEAGAEAVRRIEGEVSSTFNRSVVSGIGLFGGMLDLSEIIKGYERPILVQSIDGVGTKLLVSQMAGTHVSVGKDIVAHCINDILCQGARAISFLDYIAVEKLHSGQVSEIVSGMAEVCRESGIPLIGGEIAELPGIYEKDHYDLAGVITGIVERDKVINGKDIRSGDQLVGLYSSGLHTNGYSLARKILFDDNEYPIDRYVGALGMTIGEALLKPHINYAPAVLPLLKRHEIKGIAHITGGGLLNNLPRIFPEGCGAEIFLNSWERPQLFLLLEELGQLPQTELFTAFNMGIGLVLVADSETAPEISGELAQAGYGGKIIGEIVPGERSVHL
ncbi:MAG: phosphoribosylformylglycinamidine cyclo-ligase [bacterium]